MSDQETKVAQSQEELDKVVVNLKFSIAEINHYLNALGQLPYTQSAVLIQAIHAQVLPQLPKEEGNGGE